MSNLEEKFNKELKAALKSELKLKNISEVPKILKVTVSMKTGKIKDDKNVIEKRSKDLAIITGQKPKVNLSRKAVSSFKLRIGEPVGLTSTLRGKRMYDFITRFINTALPRVRDFRGLKISGFDGHGNYSIGITEHTIIPEIKYEDVSDTYGFQVNITTSANDDRTSFYLLKSLGFPFEVKEFNKE